MSLQVNTLKAGDEFAANPCAWLVEQARNLKLHYLLAHADDGVIWGKFDDQYNLKLSGEVINAVQVELRAETLQQARIFDKHGELLIWKIANGFSARSVIDAENAEPDCMDENLILWGTKAERHGVFSLLIEGEQGLLHAPPAAVDKGKRLALIVRHYIGYDDENSDDALQKEGQAYVILSRLVDFTQVQGEKE